MTCACGMDSVGACLDCGERLCADHALRGSERGVVVARVQDHVRRKLGVSPSILSKATFPISVDVVRSELRPLLRFQVQRQAFLNALARPGVICRDCRINEACEAASATLPSAPVLGSGGSQRLRDAVAAYMLGDIVAWDSMESDAALKDTLFQDLIHLTGEKAERSHVPVEWEAKYYKPPSGSPFTSEWRRGEVRATEEIFHVVYVTTRQWDPLDGHSYVLSPLYMSRHGQWGDLSTPARHSVPETVKKAGWFSNEEQVFRMSWSDEPPQAGLEGILKRAAELLAPTS